MACLDERLCSCASKPWSADDASEVKRVPDSPTEHSEESNGVMSGEAVELTDEDIARSELLQNAAPEASLPVEFPFQSEDFELWRSFKPSSCMQPDEAVSVLQV
jgi:hypothetical protein